MMSKYSTCELKQGFKALYMSYSNKLWQDINIELARRLGKDEYNNFIESAEIKDKVKVKLIDFLDNIGKYGYVCIYKGRDKFLCEGLIYKLRQSQFWQLMDEYNADIDCVFFGTSENGEDAVIIKLH